jgi:hypothetical protein
MIVFCSYFVFRKKGLKRSKPFVEQAELLLLSFSCVARLCVCLNIQQLQSLQIFAETQLVISKTKPCAGDVKPGMMQKIILAESTCYLLIASIKN